jgi:hypothetical protein
MHYNVIGYIPYLCLVMGQVGGLYLLIIMGQNIGIHLCIIMGSVGRHLFMHYNGYRKRSLN